MVEAVRRTISIRPMGGLANRMIQYIAAHGIKSKIEDVDIVGCNIPEWGIETPPNPENLGRHVTFGDQRNNLHIEGLGSCLRRQEIDSVVIDSYAQHIDNFPSRVYCRSLFEAPESLGQVDGFGADTLVISIRGNEILDGRAIDYILLPLSFYEYLIENTKLRPVFFGQIGDNEYCNELRARFPYANFLAGRDPIHDFEVLRRSKNIVPSISTFSWLAAFLSLADNIFFPIAGLFNPRQARAHNLLPVDDETYKFYLFPVSYSYDISRDRGYFIKAQSGLSTYFRMVNSERVKQLISSPTTCPRNISAFLDFFDEDFYCVNYESIGNAVKFGGFPSGLSHYINHGFNEFRACMRFDIRFYATCYPLAAWEVANGEYYDLEHHYVEIGFKRGYYPFEPRRPTTRPTLVPAGANRYYPDVPMYKIVMGRVLDNLFGPNSILLNEQFSDDRHLIVDAALLRLRSRVDVERIKLLLNLAGQLGIPAKAPPPSVANGKRSIVSSVSQWSRYDNVEHEASLGNGGECRADLFFHTDVEENPFWQCDLEHVHLLSGITLFNRMEYPERARNLTAHISHDGDNWTIVGTKLDDQIFGGVDGNPLQFIFLEPTEARFVRIQLVGYGILHLYQIEVHGWNK